MPDRCLRALLLGCTAALTAAAFREDEASLMQVHALEEADLENEEELWSERSYPSAAEQLYAFDQFAAGEIAEGRAKEGSWLPVFVTGRGNGNSWNIHVADSFPGYDLPNVPSRLLRKKLEHGFADWYVDNGRLQHKGLGLMYRHSKDLQDTGAEYAPWGNIVVGSDEGDGWLKVSQGYLPMEVHGAAVLARKERRGYVTAMPRDFAAVMERSQQQAEEAQAALQQVQAKRQELAAAEGFEVGEHCDMRTRHGDWYHARIAERTQRPGVYDVIVQVDPYSVYPVKNVPATRLKKLGPRTHEALPGESPICQKEGCIEVHVQPEEGNELRLRVSQKMGAEMLMRMACNRLKVDWGDCLTRATFSHLGEKLEATARISDTGLLDQDTVQLVLAAPLSRAILEDA